MAASYNLKIDGLDALIKRLESFDKKLGDDVDKILDDAVDNIAADAKLRAPRGNTGALAASISAFKGERHNKFVVAEAPFAAYVEFGTGINVFDNNKGFTFSPEIKDFAHEFYVNGKGLTHASPFIFPALQKEKIAVIKRIKALLFT